MSERGLNLLWLILGAGCVLGVISSLLGGFVLHRGLVRAVGGITIGAVLGGAWALVITSLAALGLLGVSLV